MRLHHGDIVEYPIWIDTSMAISLTSQVFDIPNTENLAVEFSWVTSDITGTFSIQTSITGLFWNTIPDASFEPAGPFSVAGANGSHLIDLNQMGCTKLRFLFNRTGGTAGTLQGTIVGKGF